LFLLVRFNQESKACRTAGVGLNLFGNPGLKFSTMEHLGRDIGTPTDDPFVFLAIPSALVARNTRWTEEFTSLEASKEAYFC